MTDAQSIRDALAALLKRVEGAFSVTRTDGGIVVYTYEDRRGGQVILAGKTEAELLQKVKERVR